MKNILTNIDFIAIIQAFLIFIALFIKKQNKHANRILAVVILFLGIDLFEKYCVLKGYIINFPYYPWGSIHDVYFYTPALYIYTRLITGTDEKFKSINLLHFIPLIIVFLINSMYYYSIDYHNTELVKGLIFSHTISFENIIFRIIEISYFLFYILLALLMINNYSIKIKDFYSNTGKINLLWLRFFLIFQVIIQISLNIAYFTYNPEHKINWFHIIASFLGLLILFMISIFSIIHPEILDRKEFLKIETEENDASYRKFRMGETKEKKYAEMITRLMEKEKPYLNEL